MDERLARRALPHRAEIGELHHRLRAGPLLVFAALGHLLGGEHHHAGAVRAEDFIPVERDVFLLVRRFRPGDFLLPDHASRQLVHIHLGIAIDHVSIVVLLAKISVLITAQTDRHGVAGEKFRAHADARDIDREQMKLPPLLRLLMRLERFKIQARRHGREGDLPDHAFLQDERFARGETRLHGHAILFPQLEIAREFDLLPAHRAREFWGRGSDRDPARERLGLHVLGERFVEGDAQGAAMVDDVRRLDLADFKRLHVADDQLRIREQTHIAIARGQSGPDDEPPVFAGHERFGGPYEKLVAASARHRFLAAETLRPGERRASRRDQPVVEISERLPLPGRRLGFRGPLFVRAVAHEPEIRCGGLGGNIGIEEQHEARIRGRVLFPRVADRTPRLEREERRGNDRLPIRRQLRAFRRFEIIAQRDLDRRAERIRLARLEHPAALADPLKRARDCGREHERRRLDRLAHEIRGDHVRIETDFERARRRERCGGEELNWWIVGESDGEEAGERGEDGAQHNVRMV